MTAEDALENLVEECRVDHVGLWEVIRAVRFDLGSTNPAQTRALTLQLVHRLLHERGVQVGRPAADGRHFVPWELPPAQAIPRIGHEWSALGHDPDIGEVAWFTTAD
jgi:hypothetical protein